MKWQKPGEKPAKSHPINQTMQRNTEDEKTRRERERFARDLTRSLFGKHYWNDRMTEEINSDRKRNRKT